MNFSYVLKNELVFELPDKQMFTSDNQLKLLPFAFFVVDNLKPARTVILGEERTNFLLGIAYATTRLDNSRSEIVTEKKTDEFIDSIKQASEHEIKVTDQAFIAFLKEQPADSIELLVLTNEYSKELLKTEAALIHSKLNTDNSAIILLNPEEENIPTEYPSFSADLDGSLYVSLTGKKLPEGLLEMANPDIRHSVWALFSGLGMRFEQYYQLGLKSEQNSENNFKRLIGNLQKELRRIKEQAESGVTRNLEQKQTIISLNSSLNTKQDEIKRFKQRADHLEEKLKEKAKDLQSRTKELQKIEFDIKAQHRKSCNYQEYAENIKQSLSYRLGFMLTWPARKIYDRFFDKAPNVPAPALQMNVQSNVEVNNTQAQNTIQSKVLDKTKELIKPKTNPRKEKLKTYHNWRKNNEITPSLHRELQQVQEAFEYRPKISIVIPVYNVEKIWLQKAIDSISNQIYTNWELCLADDASPKPHIKPMLEEFGQSDERIKITFRKENGRISRATNSALELATGEYIAFMDNDDELSEHALFEIVNALNKDKNIDFIYSDEDKIDEDGTHMNPHFKPDWSPELFLSYNYINHLVCVRKTIVDKVNGLRPEMDGCQDYDFLLRSLPYIKTIHHIPKVLYHWRALETSIAKQGDVKQSDFSFFSKGRKALEDYLNRHQIKAKVIRPAFAVKYNLALYHLLWADHGDMVTIIVATDGNNKRLKKCLEAIRTTSYKNYEVIIISESENHKTSAVVDEFIEEFLMPIRQCYVKGTIPEQFNKAAALTESKYVLFLSNLVIPRSDDWLTQMVGYHSMSKVGVTGAKILYSDDTIYHGGVITGLYPGAYDNIPYVAFRNLANKALGYYFYPHVPRNYSAVSGGCCLMAKSLFDKVNGFNATEYPIAYYDIDLCIRVQKKGFRNVYVSNAEMTYSGNKKARIKNVSEIVSFKGSHGGFEERYYNKNLSDYQLYNVWPGNSQNYFELGLSHQPLVLMVTHNLNFEGAPIQMYEIVKGILEKQEIRFEIVSPKDGPLRARYEAINVPVSIKEEWKPDNASGYQGMIEDMKIWMQAFDFSAVFVNTLIPFHYLKAAEEAGIPSIWCIHESYNYKDFYAYLPRGLKTKAYECFKYPQMNIYVAKTTKDLYKSVDYKNSFTVINNGLRTEDIRRYLNNNSKAEVRKELGIPEDKVVFLNLGTVCQRKGQLDFTKAAIQSVEAGNENSLFYMVGGRPDNYMAKINKEIEKSNTEQHFRIEMETGDVFKYYRAADVFVCTSYIESYPRVILEAMVFSLPILTTPIYGITEQVIKDVNANFFRPGDIDGLADGLTEFAERPMLRSTYAENAPNVFRLVNTYEEMLAKYEKFIKSTCLSNYKTTKTTELITVSN